jgi:hypothetical protein
MALRLFEHAKPFLDLMLSETELRQERAELLNWFATHAPRTRKRTNSIPIRWRLLTRRTGYGANYGSTHSSEAGTMGNEKSHKRATTLT